MVITDARMSVRAHFRNITFHSTPFWDMRAALSCKASQELGARPAPSVRGRSEPEAEGETLVGEADCLLL